MNDMDAGARGWLMRTAQKNYWRVASWYDLDDLIQDGYMTYYKVRARYPDAKDRAHIMRLFQTCYTNHIHDLAKDRTKLPECLVSDMLLPEADEVRLWDKLLDNDNEMATLRTLVGQAPEPIKAVLNMLASETGTKRLRSIQRVRKTKIRSTLNARLCKLAGIDEINLRSAFRSHFSTV